MNGLYDGEFAGYKIASAAELDTALREAVVAVDANVLLDLYRFSPRTSSDLINTFKSLGDRLVVPHQALREFWRHRQRAQGSPRGATKTATDALAKAGRSMNDALGIWAKAVGFNQGDLGGLTGEVDALVRGLQEKLQQALAHADADRVGDPILEQLEGLLRGRVTSPLADEEHASCVAEAGRRITAEIPPGYKDAGKQEDGSADGGAGDYLVWYQATRYAQEHQRDLLIVTRDEKEDWWWRQGAEFIGPRPELSLEYQGLTGRRLFLMRPTDLLARASVLEVEVDEESSADAGRSLIYLDEIENQQPATWTLEELAVLLVELDAHAPPQAAALRLAAKGHPVHLDQVPELGAAPGVREMTMFASPYHRLTATLQAQGLLHPALPRIFRYDLAARTECFVVPPEVPALLRTLAAN
ncbi:PIN-like domain-containing protein [Lentzea sp. JNUCC 0626]|uniref:PIN-like domain-containing protein n=1 Tax=Lentzea sp. JNUCC 0626 TaxID=3367513 RepID=UPI0037483CE7